MCSGGPWYKNNDGSPVVDCVVLETGILLRSGGLWYGTGSGVFAALLLAMTDTGPGVVSSSCSDTVGGSGFTDEVVLAALLLVYKTLVLVPNKVVLAGNAGFLLGIVDALVFVTLV